MAMAPKRPNDWRLMAVSSKPMAEFNVFTQLPWIVRMAKTLKARALFTVPLAAGVGWLAWPALTDEYLAEWGIGSVKSEK